MITPERLAAVATAARQNPTLSALRPAFPDLHFSECSDDDVSPRYRPALTLESHKLYLISGASGHCLEFTNDTERATGILLASKVDDA